MRWRDLIPMSALGLLVAGVAIVIVRPSGSGPNEADRVFVAEMRPHHHLGMRLIDEATTNSDDVRLRRMVFEMEAYHSTEIEQFDRWADAWGVPPAAEFPGELPENEVQRLAATHGAAHDALWLALMITHHRGALEITAAESDGAVARARAMATSIARTQIDQIAAMEELLDELCTSSPTSSGCSGTPDAPTR